MKLRFLAWLYRDMRGGRSHRKERGKERAAPRETQTSAVRAPAPRAALRSTAGRPRTDTTTPRLLVSRKPPTCTPTWGARGQWLPRPRGPGARLRAALHHSGQQATSSVSSRHPFPSGPGGVQAHHSPGPPGVTPIPHTQRPQPLVPRQPPPLSPPSSPQLLTIPDVSRRAPPHPTPVEGPPCCYSALGSCLLSHGTLSPHHLHCGWCRRFTAT